MKRTPLARYTPLRAQTPLKARSMLARTVPVRPVSRKRAQQNRERRAMLAAKYPERVLCEVPWCTCWADDGHEPLTRARGGSITDPGNVKAVCRQHHDEITFEEPDWAYDLGFLRHSWADGSLSPDPPVGEVALWLTRSTSGR